MMMHDHLRNSADLKARLASDEAFVAKLGAMAQVMIDALKAGKKILVAGNGGSAAQSDHFVAELVGRYERDRAPQKAMSLISDIATLTSLSNDFGYENVFAKQVEALGDEGDCMLGISTSGNSENVLRALVVAGKRGMKCLGLAGRDGGKMPEVCEEVLIVDSEKTPLIQEVHLSVLHMWADLIEKSL